MSQAPPRGGRWRAGWGWLVLLSIPPVVVVVGLVALFVWQGAKGGVRGKWQKAPVATNAVAPAKPPGG